MYRTLIIIFVVIASAFYPRIADAAEKNLDDLLASVKHIKAKQDLDDLLVRIEQIRKKHGVAAVGLAITRGDEILFAGGFGVRDWETQKPVTADTLFRLGSVTKSFTGLAALRMSRDHPDLLQKPANKVLDNILTEPAGSKPVTLESLLEHSAGLTDLGRSEFDFQGEFVTYAEAIEIEPQTRVLKWPAQQHSSYSNAGYGIAGYMLEKYGDDSYENLVRKYVLEPLGMNNSGFYQNKSSMPLATGYNTDGVTPIPYWHMIYRSFGGLNSTPRDMARFLTGLVTRKSPDSGKVFLDDEEQQRFEHPQTTLAASAGLDYGYGLGNYQWFRKRVRFHGHGGDADGYLSHYGYDRTSGMAYFVVVTAFDHKPLRAMRNNLEDFIVDHSERIQLPESVIEPAQLKQWTGTYEVAATRFGVPGPHRPVLKITQNGDKLITDYNGSKNDLLPVDGLMFRRPWQPAATYAFVVDKKGDTYLQGDLGNFKKRGTRRR